MHPQLQLLLEIQDLKGQIKDIEAAEEGGEIEREFFKVQPEEAVDRLREKVSEMEAELDPDVRSRYLQVVGRRERAVVPVVHGDCYGCFMAMPTGVRGNNERLSWCENCGSFVYYVD